MRLLPAVDYLLDGKLGAVDARPGAGMRRRRPAVVEHVGVEVGAVDVALLEEGAQLGLGGVADEAVGGELAAEVLDQMELQEHVHAVEEKRAALTQRLLIVEQRQVVVDGARAAGGRGGRGGRLAGADGGRAAAASARHK